MVLITLADIVRSASTREDEVHNCQVVIDSLAGDVLHTSLTHISGADIIDGNRESMSNLLEILVGLLDYMLNKIDSDISTYTGRNTAWGECKKVLSVP